MSSSLSGGSGEGSTGWLPPEVGELQRLLPQYKIESILGRGGMGAVYRGTQVALERPVAIKLLPDSLITADDENNFVERFKLEARAMGGLDHPAIISVYDFGQTSEGHLYFVMEFIDGMDIHNYIQMSEGKVDQEHAVAIVSHVLDALDYAHSKGIVHRDIKPANVLINRDGKVKIADFGLAKKLDSGGGEPALTMSNVALGTPDFIAPEALDSSSMPDGRADLYAVGVMLYQMLTGKLPRGIFRMPSEEEAGLDQRIDDIITLALESDPDHRYQTAREFRMKLDELQTKPIQKIAPELESKAVPAAAEQFGFTEPGLRRSESIRRHGAHGASSSGGAGKRIVGWGITLIAMTGCSYLWISGFGSSDFGDSSEGLKMDPNPVVPSVETLSPADTPAKSSPVSKPEQHSALSRNTASIDGKNYYIWKVPSFELQLLKNSVSEEKMKALLGFIKESDDYWADVMGYSYLSEGVDHVVYRDTGDEAVKHYDAGEKWEVYTFPFGRLSEEIEKFETQDLVHPNLLYRFKFYEKSHGSRIIRPHGKADEYIALNELMSHVVSNKSAYKRPGPPWDVQIRLDEEQLQLWEDYEGEFDSWQKFSQKGLLKFDANEVRSRPVARALLFHLYNEYGEDAFFRRWLGYEVPLRPVALSNEEADDNFVVSASRAAGADLTPFFEERMKWYVSDAAKTGIQQYFAALNSKEEGLLRRYFSEPLNRKNSVLEADPDKDVFSEIFLRESFAAGRDLSSFLIDRLGWPVADETLASVRKRTDLRIDGLVADGKWQDLGTLFQNQGTIIAGEWEVAPGRIWGAESELNRSIIGRPTEPLASYDMRWVTRFHGEGAGDLALLFPTKEGAAILIHAMPLGVIGLEQRSGRSIFSPGVGTPTAEGLFELRKDYEFLVEVRPDRFSVFLNREPLAEWDNIDWREYRQGGFNAFRHRDVIGVSSPDKNQVEFRSFEIRIPDPEGAFADPDPYGSPPVVEVSPEVPVVMELRELIETFQGDRKEQLISLMQFYRARLDRGAANALNEKQAEDYRKAIQRSEELVVTIKSVSGEREVRRLPVLAPLESSAPVELIQLRATLDSKIIEIESALISAFDKNLTTLEQALRQAERKADAGAVKAYQRELRGKSR
ncbi:protein kinase [Verrucomicrobiales bacterium BCK34]|nr:protein kinase [Verrucomicrobiales bacterium BCK34]